MGSEMCIRDSASPPPSPPPGFTLSRESTMLCHASWTFAELLDTLSGVSSVPREYLSVAKPPSVQRQFNIQAIQALIWDDARLIGALKIGAPPVRASHGEMFLVRDKRHANALVQAVGSKPSGGRDGRGRGSRSHGEIHVASARAASKRETAMRIHTVFDDQ